MKINAGHEKDVDGKEATQGGSADGRAAEDKLRQPIADQRERARLVRPRSPLTKWRSDPSAEVAR